MASGQVTTTPFVPSTATSNIAPSIAPKSGTSIDNLAMETRHQIIRYTHPESSPAQLAVWLRLNRKIHEETKSYMTPDIEADFVNRVVDNRMEKYYKGGDPYKEVLDRAKNFFANKRHVRFGLFYSKRAAGSTRIPAPSYWPSQGIKPSNLPDLLAQLDEKTDLQTLEVGLAIGALPPSSWEPYETPTGGYFDAYSSMDKLGRNIEKIFAELAKIKRNNPQCEISLSVSFSFLKETRALTLSNTTMADYAMYRKMPYDAFSKALEKYPCITTLNVITNNERLVLLAAHIAGHEKQKIHTIRFHLFMTAVSPKISHHLSRAMMDSKRPLSLECRMHPSRNSGWRAYDEDERRQIETTVLSMKNMIVAFAASGKARSLRLIVPPRLAQIMLFALKKNAEFDSLQSDDEVSETSLVGAEKFLESGLDELKQRESPRFTHTVKHRRFEAERTWRSVPSTGTRSLLQTEGQQGSDSLSAIGHVIDVFDEFDVLLQRNVPEETADHPVIEAPGGIIPESLRHQWQADNFGMSSLLRQLPQDDENSVAGEWAEDAGDSGRVQELE